MKYIAISIVPIIALSCSSYKNLASSQQEENIPMFPSINTGVLYEGREIVVLDRNIGAKSYGDVGDYLTWEEAIKACPKGYHLMTKKEMRCLLEDDNYKDRRWENWTNGVLGYTLSGYIPYSSTESIVENDSMTGYYHLAGLCDENESLAVRINDREIKYNFLFFYNYKRDHKDRMLGRCVKDYIIRESRGVSKK